MKTQNLSALIVDDETEAREMISFLLEDMFPQIEIAGKADGVHTALQEAARLKPDLIFLDIEMGDGTGFDFIAKQPEQNSQVIFVTAHDNYAIAAIKASAIDYILKPVNRDEFKQAVGKALKRAGEHNAHEYRLPAENPLPPNDVRKIGLPNLTGLTFVSVDSITRCEADGNYTSVFFNDVSKKVISRPLSHFENDLKRFGFLRIHHKHLVNLNLIQSYSKGKGGGYVTLNNGIQLEVSARKKPDLLRALSQSEHY